MKKYLEKPYSGMVGRPAAGLAFMLLGVGLQYIARNTEYFANWYTRNIYPVWVNVLGRVFSSMPFSAVEILLYAAVFLAVFNVVKGIAGVVKKKKSVGDTVLSGMGRAVLFAGAIFLIYTLTCGINYHRDTFSELSGLEMKPYTVAQLAEFCGKLTGEVNEASSIIEEKVKTGAGGEKTGMRKGAVDAMEELGQEYVMMSGYYPMPKPVAVSEILSYQHLTGVYSPFTIEANYNQDMTDYNIPFTMCHELSHLRGFMREDEANYTAYLACVKSEDERFQYSGKLMAWIYSTNVLYKYDEEKYRELYDTLSDRVKYDLAQNNAFWDFYEGAVSEMADAVNDTYLKANKQTDGVESYDRMVNLLMAEYLENSQ